MPINARVIGLADRPADKKIDKISRIVNETKRLVREVKDHNKVYQQVCEMLRNDFPYYSWVGIYIVEGDYLSLRAWVGDHSTEHTRIKVGEGICGLAAETGKTVIVPDVTKDFRYIMCFATTMSEIVVPIHKGKTVHGEIDIDSEELDAFDSKDESFLEQVAEVLTGLYK
jgi:GAF domain-containing protein